jgi:hypothetical protein
MSILNIFNQFKKKRTEIRMLSVCTNTKKNGRDKYDLHDTNTQYSIYMKDKRMNKTQRFESSA